MDQDQKNNIHIPVSVVIATLGNECLFRTIEFLNSKSTKPYEILICIPDKLYFKVSSLTHSNVKIIKTNKYGQVYQRYIGFLEATQNYILQLDDDIEINANDIQKLITTLTNLNKNSAIGPQFFNKKLNDYCYKNLSGFKKYESYVIEYFIGGAIFGAKRMGTISKTGNNFEYDINFMKNNVVNVEWLAGGCILHHKENILKEDFFPFNGKAYCEDLIHSVLLRKNGINLFITKEVVCTIDEVVPPITYLEILKEKTARQYLIYLLNGSINRSRLLRLYWAIKFKLNKFI